MGQFSSHAFVLGCGAAAGPAPPSLASGAGSAGRPAPASRPARPRQPVRGLSGAVLVATAAAAACGTRRGRRRRAQLRAKGKAAGEATVTVRPTFDFAFWAENAEEEQGPVVLTTLLSKSGDAEGAAKYQQQLDDHRHAQAEATITIGQATQRVEEQAEAQRRKEELPRQFTEAAKACFSDVKTHNGCGCEDRMLDPNGSYDSSGSEAEGAGVMRGDCREETSGGVTSPGQGPNTSFELPSTFAKLAPGDDATGLPAHHAQGQRPPVGPLGRRRDSLADVQWARACEGNLLDSDDSGIEGNGARIYVGQGGGDSQEDIMQHLYIDDRSIFSSANHGRCDGREGIIEHLSFDDCRDEERGD
ncbi:unnamed protein product [Prorocentrum cordatum]|uniref:Pectate lyase n=1 Tax=Prorocentrum cordatum TaxID=2364126 RepID=A0ABN9WHW9_9DINO|nr:unnamed protein product [Polarella glacialis]